MAYLPRPDPNRTAQDVDEIYMLAAEELQKADTPVARQRAFRNALLRAYEAGTDAQREITRAYAHERPTPVPPPPDVGTKELGTLPPGPRPVVEDPKG